MKKKKMKKKRQIEKVSWRTSESYILIKGINSVYIHFHPAAPDIRENRTVGCEEAASEYLQGNRRTILRLMSSSSTSLQCSTELD